MDKNLEFLLSEYKDRISYLSQNLAQGACPSIEEYRYICGQIRGLEAACLIITDLKKRTEESDSD
jgi:hypothetical protein